MIPYVHSNYPRIADDNYQTIDKRCVTALAKTISLDGLIVDPCSPNGSGICVALSELGYQARGVNDAFQNIDYAKWIVSNPPYNKKVVDNIIWAQIERLYKDFGPKGVAMLLRNNFDFAKSRYQMFTDPLYWGQIHMMFRPWWSEEKKSSPIHNYVWHIWSHSAPEVPVVKYWRESTSAPERPQSD